MLSHRIVRISTASRAAVARGPHGVRCVTQDHKRVDPLNQSRSQGHKATDPSHASPLDAASPAGGKKASRDGLSGNQEGVGFADQVGSQSADGRKPEKAEGVAGEESITPPSFADAVKSKLGLKTTAGEDKQNRGGGKGVTGTGQPAFDRGKRTMHTSAISLHPDKTKGKAPASSRKPKDQTNADQNAHLKHKPKASAPDSGKGNAGNDPKLPSHQVEASSRRSKDKRGFHTSARAFAEKDDSGSNHTAESYFKDVDNSQPANPKVHQVDSSSATGAPVARANEHPATGDFSRAGPETEEYDTVSKKGQPFDTPPSSGPEAEQKLRYGNQPGLSEPSKSNEGPAGKNAGGRKPEGRS